MKGIYFYRGYTIMRNKYEDNGMNWTTLENGDFYTNTINDMKNLIDSRVGGFATAKIPKRSLKVGQGL